MASDPAWVAVFCPNCGCTLNESDLDFEDHDLFHREPGSTYTCGWCHTRQTDWSHVKRCRATFLLRQAQAQEQAGEATLDIYLQLTGEK